MSRQTKKYMLGYVPKNDGKENSGIKELNIVKKLPLLALNFFHIKAEEKSYINFQMHHTLKETLFTIIRRLRAADDYEPVGNLHRICFTRFSIKI